MTDIVIPLKADYPHRDIKYCLRSIEKHVTDLRRVIIIGDKPDFIQEVIHFQIGDMSGYQHAARNIFKKLIFAAEEFKEFLVVHNDHFLLTDIVAGEYPYYHRGPIIPEGKPDGYARLLQNTKDQFPEADDFDVHCPILMTAAGLNKLTALDWSKPYGYGVKTAYCVLNGIAGNAFTDCKIKTRMSRQEIYQKIEGRHVFSTGSGAYQGDMEKVLKELYPRKSRWENYKY